jgi:hypothetical protein
MGCLQSLFANIRYKFCEIEVCEQKQDEKNKKSPETRALCRQPGGMFDPADLVEIPLGDADADPVR